MFWSNSRIGWLLVGPVVLLLLVVGAASAADPGNGKALWGQLSCKSCHGDTGEGKFAGPRAGDGLTAEAWIKEVRTPKAKMPTYSVSQISDVDITDLNAFMQTLTRPATFTPAVFPIQAGDAQGKVLFAQNRCVACHSDGAGLVKARFTDRGRQVTAADVVKQLRTPAQRMPSYASTQISDADAGLIANYLGTLALPSNTPAMLPRTGEALPYPVIAMLGLVLVAVGIAARRVASARR